MWAPAVTASLVLPELAASDQLLAAQPSLLLRLFHALGGRAAWFRRRVWPLLRIWEAQTAGLPWHPPPARPSGLAGGEVPLRDAHPSGTLLEQVLGRVCALAEAQSQIPLAQLPDGLHRLHRCALEQSWQYLQGIVLSAPGGETWRPGTTTVRSWREARPQPQCMQRAVAAAGQDPWVDAARVLVAQGLWRLDSPTGRWLGQSGDWGLLWPLAGQDLSRVLAMQHAGAPSAACVRSGLAHWDHLADVGGLPADWQRGDGRVLSRLPVRERFRRACGLA